MILFWWITRNKISKFWVYCGWIWISRFWSNLLRRLRIYKCMESRISIFWSSSQLYGKMRSYLTWITRFNRVFLLFIIWLIYSMSAWYLIYFFDNHKLLHLPFFLILFHFCWFCYWAIIFSLRDFLISLFQLSYFISLNIF